MSGEPPACETGVPHWHIVQDGRGIRQVDCERRGLLPDEPRRAELTRHVMGDLLDRPSTVSDEAVARQFALETIDGDHAPDLSALLTPTERAASDSYRSGREPREQYRADVLAALERISLEFERGTLRLPGDEPQPVTARAGQIGQSDELTPAQQSRARAAHARRLAAEKRGGDS